MPGFFVEMEVSLTFLPGLVLNHDPPDLCLWNRWDYRSEQLYQAGIFLREANLLDLPLLHNSKLFSLMMNECFPGCLLQSLGIFWSQDLLGFWISRTPGMMLAQNRPFQCLLSERKHENIK
jgi:hypothetical protein